LAGRPRTIRPNFNTIRELKGEAIHDIAKDDRTSKAQKDLTSVMEFSKSMSGCGILSCDPSKSAETFKKEEHHKRGYYKRSRSHVTAPSESESDGAPPVSAATGGRAGGSEGRGTCDGERPRGHERRRS